MEDVEHEHLCGDCMRCSLLSAHDIRLVGRRVVGKYASLARPKVKQALRGVAWCDEEGCLVACDDDGCPMWTDEELWEVLA